MAEEGPFTENRREAFLEGRLVSRYFGETEEHEINPKEFFPDLLSSDIRKNWHIKTMRDNLEIYIYNEEKGIYESNGRQMLRELIKKALGEYYREYHATGVINDITASTGVDRQELEPLLNLIPIPHHPYNVHYYANGRNRSYNPADYGIRKEIIRAFCQLPHAYLEVVHREGAELFDTLPVFNNQPYRDHCPDNRDGEQNGPDE